MNLEEKRKEMISKHRQEMPAIHKANYNRAVSGKSRKAGTKAFCLECVQWQKEEVRLCTSLDCALYPYRPYKESPKQASQVLSFFQESSNSENGEVGL